MTSTIKEHLIAARALIDTPEKWALSSVVDAMSRVAGSSYGDFRAMRNVLYDLLPYKEQTLTGYNRDHTHADIMSLFDRAIAAQETSHAG